MRISSAQLYDRPLANMSALTIKADKLQGQIATGKRIANASDDAAGYARLAGLKRAAAAEQADTANLNMAKTLVAQSDSTLATIETQLQRVQELTIQAKNDTLSPEQKKVIGATLDSLLDDLVSLANSKDARGQPLFGGSGTETPYTRDPDGTVRYQATGTPPPMPIGDETSVQATDSGAKLFGGIALTDGTTTDMFAVVAALADALKAGEPVPAEQMDALTTTLDQVAAARASFGARGARLDIETQRMAELAAQRETQQSEVEGTNIEAAIVELQKTLTVLQATQASFSKLSQLSLFDYLR